MPDFPPAWVLFTFMLFPAAHDLDVDDLGRHCYLGYVVEFGPWAVYHSGDTLVYDGLDRLVESVVSGSRLVAHQWQEARAKSFWQHVGMKLPL